MRAGGLQIWGDQLHIASFVRRRGEYDQHFALRVSHVDMQSVEC